MPDVSLVDIIKEWVESLNSPFYCLYSRILYPCYCGSPIQFATIWSADVTLIRAACDCIDCKRHVVDIAVPTSIEDLYKSLMSRIDHKSINICSDAKTGDDLRHLVAHCKGGVLNITGNFDGVEVDVSQIKLNIGDAVITNCKFDNITSPITVSGEATFKFNSFFCSPDVPPLPNNLIL